MPGTKHDGNCEKGAEWPLVEFPPGPRASNSYLRGEVPRYTLEVKDACLAALRGIATSCGNTDGLTSSSSLAMRSFLACGKRVVLGNTAGAMVAIGGSGLSSLLIIGIFVGGMLCGGDR